MKYRHLPMPTEWKETFTKYPHGMTVWEAICTWVGQTDNMIDNLNLNNEKIDTIFDETLPGTVEDILNQWDEDGTLADLVNLNLFNSKADKTELEEANTEIEAIKGDVEELQKGGNLKEVTNQNIRVALISDIHYDSQQYKGMTPHNRMNWIVNMLNTEHGKKPIDMVLITGDISSNEGNTIEVINRYFKKLHVPFYILAGNHDLVSDSEWKANFHYLRDYSIVHGDYAFLITDTFNGSQLPEQGYYGQQPSPVNMELLQRNYEKVKDKNIFVIYHGMFGSSHHADLKDFIITKENIIAGFEGHWHTTGKVELSPGKYSFRNGHMSYGSGNNELDPWSFRVIEKREDKLITEIVQPLLAGSFPQPQLTKETDVIGVVNSEIADIYINPKEYSLYSGNMVESFIANTFRNLTPRPVHSGGTIDIINDTSIQIDTLFQTGFYYAGAGNGAPFTGMLLVMGYSVNNYVQLCMPINPAGGSQPIKYRTRNAGTISQWYDLPFQAS